MPSGSVSCIDRLLADLDEVAEVVRDDVADDDRHHRVREPVRQRRGGVTPSRTPVAIVASENVTPTTAQNTSRASEVQQHVEVSVEDWVNRSHSVESLKLSNAVLPNSTATTPTRPGRARTPSRLPSGLRSTSVPSAVRPNTDRWPTSVE